MGHVHITSWRYEKKRPTICARVAAGERLALACRRQEAAGIALACQTNRCYGK